jgi:protein involved in polysaccharide export with SLBB domain
MASIGQLLQLAGGMPSRVSSSDNAVLTGDLSGLGTISSVALSASGAISGGSLSVSGSSVLADVSAASLAVSGNGSFGGTLSVTGASSLSSLKREVNSSEPG